MNYHGKNIVLTGWDGFIGSALAKRLKAEGANVYEFRGDIRNKSDLTSYINHRIDYVFHFGAPSSQVQFTRQHRYCVETTIQGFSNISSLCAENGVRLVYPSTGLLSQGKSNEYARCKQICEDLAATNELDSIGIRIFATYGPGEGHKRDYASVPYLFARDMVNGVSPVIFGDGEQVRDFIWIDDVVNAIVVLAEECSEKVVDLGTGEQVSFNEIIIAINSLRPEQRPIHPTYVDKPNNYVESTQAQAEFIKNFAGGKIKPQVSFTDGIKKLVKHLEDEKIALGLN